MLVSAMPTRRKGIRAADEKFLRDEFATLDLRGTDDIIRVKEPQSGLGAISIECPNCKQPPGYPCFRESFKRAQALGYGGRVVMKAPHKERVAAWKGQQMLNKLES